MNRTLRTLNQISTDAENGYDALVKVNAELQDVIADLLQELANREPKGATLQRGLIRHKGDNTIMALTLQDDQKVDYSASETDDAGNSTPFQGSVAWSVSDSTILNIDSVSDDTSSATISATGTLGGAQVSATVTLPDGSTVTLTDDVTVVTSPPVNASLTAGTPVHQ